MCFLSQIHTVIWVLDSKHLEKHGPLETYPTREVRPRYLLGIRDSTTPQSEHIYAKQLRIWELEKKGKKTQKEEEKIKRKIDRAWEELEDEIFLQWQKKMEETEA